MEDIIISAKFDAWRDLIDRARKQNRSWNEIKVLGTADWIKQQVDSSFLPQIDEQQWTKIVDAKEEAELSAQEVTNIYNAENDDSLIA
jgi:hypothetical protein